MSGSRITMTDLVNEQQIALDEIRREGGDKETDDPSDSGGRTKYGIAEASNPDLWKNGPPTEAQAIDRFEERYIKPFEGIRDTGLLHQLVDFAVTAGVEPVTKILQQLVGVTADGQLGPKTIQAIEAFPQGTLFGVPVPGFVLLNLAVRDARVLFYAGISKRWPKNLRFLLGWMKRAFEFK